MRVRATEVLRRKAQHPGLVQGDLNDLKFEMRELETALAQGDNERAMYAAKNVSETASALMSNLRGIIKMPSYPSEY